MTAKTMQPNVPDERSGTRRTAAAIPRSANIPNASNPRRPGNGCVNQHAAIPTHVQIMKIERALPGVVGGVSGPINL